LATLYLSRSALSFNLQKLRSKNPNIIGVIKDNAYGHGLLPIAKLLHKFGVERVAVRNHQEGIAVLPFFKEILILYPHTGRSYPNFSYAINSMDQLLKNRHPRIHLKVDTGMHRNGISPKELTRALELIKKKDLELVGVFSHLCCADEKVEIDTFIQLERFKQIRQQVLEFVHKAGIQPPYFHLANSAGVEKLPPSQLYDFIRPGIALYGGLVGYRPVAKLVGKPILVRSLKPGEGIGYNKKFTANRPLKITFIDLGYGDGIPYFSGKIKLAGGVEAVGKISMDSMAVVGEFKKEVVVFDNIRQFAQNFNTITYDLLVKLHPRINRIVVE